MYVNTPFFILVKNKDNGIYTDSISSSLVQFCSVAAMLNH